MGMRNVVLGAVVVGILSVLGLSLMLAEGAERPPRGERGRFDPERMRQRMNERLKETLQVTDEDWVALLPLIEKVQTLSREAGGTGGRRMMFGRRGGRRRPAEAEEPQSDVAKATQELQTLQEDEAAPAADIKAKLTALREAREKVKEKLAVAQEALREVVTQRQEAKLVLMSLLP